MSKLKAIFTIGVIIICGGLGSAYAYYMPDLTITGKVFASSDPIDIDLMNIVPTLNFGSEAASVTPGDYVLFWFELMNYGLHPASDVTVRIQHPIGLIFSDDWKANVYNASAYYSIPPPQDPYDYLWAWSVDENDLWWFYRMNDFDRIWVGANYRLDPDYSGDVLTSTLSVWSIDPESDYANNQMTITLDVTEPIPEPATILLFFLGLFGIFGVSRKKHKLY